MKRVVSAFLAVVLLACFPVTAYATSTTITANVPAPSYELTIVEHMNLSYGSKGADFSPPIILNSSGFKEGTALKISISYTGEFTCEGVETTIPYTFAIVNYEELQSGNYEMWNSGDSLYYYRNADGCVSEEGSTESGKSGLFSWLTIVPGSWELALPGEYTTTITYEASIISTEGV